MVSSTFLSTLEREYQQNCLMIDVYSSTIIGYFTIITIIIMNHHQHTRVMSSTAISFKYHIFDRFINKYHITLGSNSSTRKMILHENGFHYTTTAADINEKAIGNRLRDPPKELVVVIALAKANAIMSKQQQQQATHRTNDILLTADQVVVYDGCILEKPVDLTEARVFINRYSNSCCSTVGSIVLTDVNNSKQVCGVDTATIHFDVIPQQVIDKIIDEGEVIHCAGGLMVEHPLLQPYIKQVDGTYDSLMGLSCALLASLLDRLELPQ